VTKSRWNYLHTISIMAVLPLDILKQVALLTHPEKEPI